MQFSHLVSGVCRSFFADPNNNSSKARAFAERGLGPPNSRVCGRMRFCSVGRYTTGGGAGMDDACGGSSDDSDGREESDDGSEDSGGRGGGVAG